MDEQQTKPNVKERTESEPSVSSSINEDIIASLQLEEPLTPAEKLRRFLSIRSVTSPLFVERQQAAVGIRSLFRPIGAGTCGRVFEVPGKPYVLKLANSDDHWLWNDFRMHAKVGEAFDSIGCDRIEVHVPRLHFFVNKNDALWWNQSIDRLPKDFQKPSHVLCSERILPLAKPIREALVDTFCPPELVNDIKTSAANKDCLVRLYLGKRRVTKSPFFSLRNFILHLDQMEDLELDYFYFARCIAEALAILHWKVGIDANDVEFVLGSAPDLTDIPDSITLKPLTSHQVNLMQPNSSTWSSHVLDFKQRITHIWLLDFNRCEVLSQDDIGIRKAVQAFFRNDPYFPRPHRANAKDQQLWAAFRDQYLATSANYVAKGKEPLPQLFIKKVVEEQKKRMTSGRDARNSEG